MAMADHLLRFRAMSTEALLVKQAALEAQDTIFQQQSMGTKSFTRDLRLLTEQLNAVAFVLRERGAMPVPVVPERNTFVGVTDFSGI